MKGSANNENQSKYKVKKIFNNNVILATKNNQKQELVLVGKGLGFSAEQGEIIRLQEKEIDREFIPVHTEEKKKKYQQLLEEVDNEVIGLTEEIIAMIASQLNEELDKRVRIALANHIEFTLQRLEQGMEITNPFLRETKTLYEKEYQLAQQAVKIIENRFSISIPEEEIGFITLHIHAARSERKVSATAKYTSLIGEMVNIIEEEWEVTLSYQSLNYARLITHLRFALERIENNVQKDTKENPLLNKIEIIERIKLEFTKSYQLSNKLVNFMSQELQEVVPKNEVGYLTIHLERLRENL